MGLQLDARVPYVASQVVFMRPAAKFVSYVYSTKLTQQFRLSGNLLLFSKCGPWTNTQ